MRRLFAGLFLLACLSGFALSVGRMTAGACAQVPDLLAAEDLPVRCPAACAAVFAERGTDVSGENGADVTLLSEAEVAVSLAQPGFWVRFRTEGCALMQDGAAAEDSSVLLPAGVAEAEGETVCAFTPLKAGKSELWFVFLPDGGGGPLIRKVAVTVIAGLEELSIRADKASYREGETAVFTLTAGEAGPLTGEIVWLLDGQEVGRGERLTLEEVTGIRELTARVATLNGTAEAAYILRAGDLIFVPESVRAVAAPIGILLLSAVIVLYAFRRIRRDPLKTLDGRLEQCGKKLKELAGQAEKQNEKRALRALRYAAFLAQEAALKAESCAADEICEAETAAGVRRAERILSAACRTRDLTFAELGRIAGRTGELLAHSRSRLSALIEIRARTRKALRESNDRRARQEFAELKPRRRAHADERPAELDFLTRPEAKSKEGETPPRQP